ncbi:MULTISPECIES: hypothetical protein [unclassified Nonomuraea]|uniref:hypothetical protein n=1 Tax=unclassified Nonomuraea TaxID=2593643 RepID=UPI0033F0B4C8
MGTKRTAAGESEQPELAAMKHAYEQIQGKLLANPDCAEAFRLATELAESLREMAEEAALARARSAARISEAESLSLAGLADKLGVSKARASQLLRVARGSEIDPSRQAHP